MNIERDVIFEGKLMGNELAMRYQEATVFVLYPTRSSDAFPLVILEAQASKLPVVSADIGAMPYLIRNNETGILVPPKNSRALGEAIMELLNNGELASKLAENAYRTIGDFTWQKSAESTLSVYREVLKL